jgi:FKBP-type peptidyl-prolyl cis-trans isomerase (trigger factor)
MPEWNDELVEKASGKKQSLDDFKAEIRKDIAVGKENEQKNKVRDQYLEKFEKVVKVELPEQLVHQEAHEAIHQFEHELEHKKTNLVEYLKTQNQTEKEFHDAQHEAAEKRLTLQFGIRELLKTLDISVEPNDIQAKIDEMMAMYPPESADAIRQHYAPGSKGYQMLANNLIMDKLFAKVLPE